MADLKKLALEMFELFARKCFHHDHGFHLSEDPFVTYICDELQVVSQTNGGKLVITLPPRHGKTMLVAYMAAWHLGHHPAEKIIVVTYSKDLAEKITYIIRRTMQTEFYKSIFQTRIAKDRKKVDDFATKQGGGVFATSINGALAGHGAGLIIVDDALNLRDAGDPNYIREVNRIFENEILSRLNHPKTGRVVVIGHRLHEEDLPAYAMKLNYRRVELPLVAVRRKAFALSTGIWVREKGDLLRSGSHTKAQIERLKSQTLPSYDLFYQQGLGARFRPIRPKHFGSFRSNEILPGPVVMSVDTSQKIGKQNSFSVFQIWAPQVDAFFLIHQTREQCGFVRCRSLFWKVFKKFRPSAVLIEDRANGSALIEEIREKKKVNLVAVDPGRRSKAERLREHAPLIRRGGILLPEDAPWRQDFITEVVEFPSQFTDQVDAMTQTLDFMSTNPRLPPSPDSGGVVGGCTSRGPIVSTPGSRTVDLGRGGVIVLASRRWPFKL